MRNNKEEDGASCLNSTHACQRVSLCAHVCKKGTGRGHEGQTRRRHPKQAKGKNIHLEKNKRGGGKCATTATTPNEETLGSCTRATEKADSPHTHTHIRTPEKGKRAQVASVIPQLIRIRLYFSFFYFLLSALLACAYASHPSTRRMCACELNGIWAGCDGCARTHVPISSLLLHS